MGDWKFELVIGCVLAACGAADRILDVAERVKRLFKK